MNILFVGYWGINEGLTSATIIPHLKILDQFTEVNKIIFCTIEREGGNATIRLGKVKHIPLYSKNNRNVLINKFDDFIRFPKILIGICHDENINLVICRSSLAGALGYLVWRKNKIPYVVESFEPHAAYMRDSDTWKFYDPRYFIQRFFENRQKKTARNLVAVSNNYAKKLISEGIDKNRIDVMPCCVPLEKFLFDNNKRNEIRTILRIPSEAVVGIYVGKYGDIYYDEEAFELYEQAFKFFGEGFYLIILSASPLKKIQDSLNLFKIPKERVFVNSVAHEKVRDYLSAADFAFSTIRPSPHRKYCSPIKDGEYWANGLPILIENGIGDDSDIIQNEGGGVLLDLHNPEKSFKRLLQTMKKGRKELASEIVAIAYRHRRLEIVEQTYKGMINEFLSWIKTY